MIETVIALGIVGWLAKSVHNLSKDVSHIRGEMDVFPPRWIGEEILGLKTEVEDLKRRVDKRNGSG